MMRTCTSGLMKHCPPGAKGLNIAEVTKGTRQKARRLFRARAFSLAIRLALLQQQRPDDRGHACGLRGIARRGDRIPACDGGFRGLGRRGATRLEALLERFQLTLATLRRDGIGRGDGKCDLEVQEYAFTLGAAFFQLRSRSARRGGKPRLQRLLAVHAEQRERLPGGRHLGGERFRHSAGGGCRLQLLAQRRSGSKALEAPAVRLVLLRRRAALGFALLIPLLALRIPLGALLVLLCPLLVLLRALLFTPCEYRVGGRVEARPKRLLVFAPQVHAAGFLPGLLQCDRRLDRVAHRRFV